MVKKYKEDESEDKGVNETEIRNSIKLIVEPLTIKQNSELNQTLPKANSLGSVFKSLHIAVLLKKKAENR
ncbi:hypothetical protein [Bacillus sp. S3]|uniref:hypothetical protein n=1 Tax=Bacillus sp. S3 TaxID=486398 RepID=UPI0016817AF0|nr:hypothetical protein [Bacillus sp. S3]